MNLATRFRPWLIILPLAVAVAEHGSAQTRLNKPPVTRNPTIVVGPASLTAVSTRPGQVILTWPAVANAERYQIQFGRPGNTVADFIASALVFEGASCMAGSGMPNCVYVDATEPFAKKLPSGSVYPHRVAPGYDSTYWIVAVFADGVTSSPSSPATVRVQ